MPRFKLSPEYTCLEDYEVQGDTLTFLASDEEFQSVPLKVALCPNCDGEGKHMTESMRCHGYTSDEIEENGGQDFIDEMRSGMYDVCCETCGGLGRVLVVDEGHADPDVLEQIMDSIESWYEFRREEAMERRMGY